MLTCTVLATTVLSFFLSAQETEINAAVLNISVRVAL